MSEAPKDWAEAHALGQPAQEAADNAWAAPPKLVWSQPVVKQRASDSQDAIDRLSLLSPIEYERVRETEAKSLNVRVSVLDDAVKQRRKPSSQACFLESPEPWDEAVNGDELLEGIVRTLSRYVILPSHGASTIALWVMMAHAMDCFHISPILAIESPEKRCGKTTLLSILQGLVPKPLTAANMTPAAVFRAVEALKPTLILDEADTFLTGDNPELVGIINSGHNRASAFVVRLVGDDHDVRQFATWCPKAIALIGELPSTTQDRAIPIRMRRREVGETVERRRADRRADLHVLCRQAARWAMDHADVLRACDPEMPCQLNDRAADNWRPLFAVAHAVGGSWLTTARSASLALSTSGQDDHSAGVTLLRDIREVFNRVGAQQLGAEELVTNLCDLEETPWAEWRRGEKPITSRGVAHLLKPYSIASRHSRLLREYHRADFEDAWKRYVSPTSPKQASQVSTHSDH